MLIFIIIVAVILLFLLVFFQRMGGFRFPWVQFYVKGKESGFKFHELNLLRRVAIDNKLTNPTSLFWSERTLDRCIRGTIIKFRSKGQESDEESVGFLGKLFDFRKRVEFNLPKYRLGLRSTRNITPGQILKITVPGSGIYMSTVVENMRKYLAASYPKGKPLPPGFSWKNQSLSIYFWRQEDAGYFFETKVIGDYLDRKFPIIHLNHSEKLVRTQKRGSIRLQVEASGAIFPLKSIQQSNEIIDKSPGYKCKMVDISEDGAALLVGGKAKPGLPIKIQYTLGNDTIVMCGVVKGVSYRKKTHQSVLHVQSVPVSQRMKNKILVHVYGIFTDSEKGKKKAALKNPKAKKPAPSPGK